MDPPAPGVYSSVDELLLQANAHAHAHGYKLVVVRSKTNVQGNKTWVHLACDRHGTKRNTHGLTEETRKKNRRSRRCECPMNCIANKTMSGLWELVVRNGQHNHGPNEAPKKKKKDLPPLHSSETVNLPLLRTPSSCTADFCLIPIGTPSPSVSGEIAEVARLLKRSGLHHSLHAAGTTLEGPWDDVMRIIGQAHALLHGNGVVRIQTDIRVGSRTDKQQGFEDKVASVRRLLEQDAVGDVDDVQPVPPPPPPPRGVVPHGMQVGAGPMGTHARQQQHQGMVAQGHPGMPGQGHPGLGVMHGPMNPQMGLPHHMPMV